MINLTVKPQEDSQSWKRWKIYRIEKETEKRAFIKLTNKFGTPPCGGGYGKNVDGK